jgi:hypothetical protein
MNDPISSVLVKAKSRESGFVDASGEPREFAPFRHTPAPDLDQPGTRAAYAAIARKTRRHGDAHASTAPERHVVLEDHMLLRAAPIAATCAGVLVLGVLRLADFLATSGGVPNSRDDGPILALMPFAAAAVAYTATRWWFVFRHRGSKATVPLLELGFCAACGHALRGASPVQPPRNGVDDLKETPLCACTECGAQWPITATRAPFTPDGESLGSVFPTVEGVARWRSRRALARALRAGSEDFTIDASNMQRYIATGAGARRSSGTIAKDIGADAGRASIFVLTAMFVMSFAALAIAFVTAPLRLLAGGFGPITDGALILIELSLLLFVAVRMFARARRNSRVRRVQKSVKEALAKEVCPTCTTQLVRVPATTTTTTTLYEPCSCCGSIWGRT